VCGCGWGGGRGRDHVCARVWVWVWVGTGVGAQACVCMFVRACRDQARPADRRSMRMCCRLPLCGPYPFVGCLPLCGLLTPLWAAHPLWAADPFVGCLPLCGPATHEGAPRPLPAQPPSLQHNARCAQALSLCTSSAHARRPLLLAFLACLHATAAQPPTIARHGRALLAPTRSPTGAHSQPLHSHARRASARARVRRQVHGSRTWCPARWL